MRTGLVLFGVLLAGCQAAAPPPAVVAPTAPEQVIGSLQWEITDAESEKVLGQGRRDIQLGEVAFLERKFIFKRIVLSDHFYLNMAESPSPSLKEKKGFGLTLGRDDNNQIFSWEWFVVNYEDHAYKLQEDGSLRIKMAQVGSGWEVTRTEFLSDVSLRAVVSPDGRADRPTWRVRILKGSTIRWPSMVNGVPTANN